MDLGSIKPVPSRKSSGWDYPTRESEKEKQPKHEHFKPRSVTQIRVRNGYRLNRPAEDIGEKDPLNFKQFAVLEIILGNFGCS